MSEIGLGFEGFVVGYVGYGCGSTGFAGEHGFLFSVLGMSAHMDMSRLVPLYHFVTCAVA